MLGTRNGYRRLECLLRGRGGIVAAALRLGALVVVIGTLAAVTAGSVRQQREFADRALTDIAGLGAWGFARRVHGNSNDAAATYAAMDAFDRPALGPDLARLARGVDSLTRCACGRLIPAVGVATGRYGDAGSVRYLPLTPEARADSGSRVNALRALAASTRTPRLPFALDSWGDSMPRGVTLRASFADSGATEFDRFFAVDVTTQAFQRAVLEPQVANVAMLPTGLVGGLSNRESMVVTLRTRAGTALWASSPDADSGIVARAALPGSGTLDVSVALRSAAITAILRGGIATPSRWVIWGGPVLGVLLLLATAVAIHRALDLARARAHFAAAVSHELRTPLTHILLNAETLHFGRVRDEADRAATTQTLVREARHLVHLIENVLHFSRSERWALRVQPRALRLDLLVSARADELMPLVESVSGVLVASVPAPVTVRADPDAVHLVLTNLVDNAARYSAGLVEVSVQATPGGGGTLRVDDRGPGIAPADRARALAPFGRLSAAQARHPTGSGIGLAVSDELVRAMGGTLELGDSAHGGLRVVVWLPGADDTDHAPGAS